MSMIVTVLLVVANVLAAGMILPQVTKLHRTRSVDGLSGPWIGIGMAMNLWWAGYAIQGGVWGMLPVSIAGFMVYAVLAVLFAQIAGRGAVRAVAGGAFTFGMAPLPGLLIGGSRPGRFSVKRNGDYDATDAAFLPDGDMLVTERDAIVDVVADRLHQRPPLRHPPE